MDREWLLRDWSPDRQHPTRASSMTMLQGMTSFRFPSRRMFTLQSLEEWLGGMKHTIGWWSMAYFVYRGQTRVVKCTFLLLLKKCYWDDKLQRAGYRTRCEFHAAAGNIVTDIRKFFTKSKAVEQAPKQTPFGEFRLHVDKTQSNMIFHAGLWTRGLD